MEEEHRNKLEKEKSKRKGKSLMVLTETSEASKGNINGLVLKNYADRDSVQAASTLVWMRKQILDAKTSSELDKKVEETKFGIEIELNILPRFPPVESLKGVIERCIEPFEKQLTSSDVSEGQCRLSLTREEVEVSILPMLNPLDEDIDQGVPVTVYDSAGKAYQMVLRSWSGSKLYVLRSGWTKFCRDHQLQVQDWVTVWMFRHRLTRGICFVLAFRRFSQA